MKNKLNLMLIMLVFTAIIAFGTSSNQDNKGLARVQKILGKEVYVLCEPLREYEIVDKKTTLLSSTLAGRQTIQKQMQEVINRQLKEVEKGKSKDFDAVLTDDGDVVLIIKFKE
jgi:hypothetical protein